MKTISEVIGYKIAELIFYTMCWEEPVDSDVTEDIIKSFRKEFNKLNGNR